MSKFKVLFLFGAGAECFSFNMPTGVEYKEIHYYVKILGKFMVIH